MKVSLFIDKKTRSDTNSPYSVTFINSIVIILHHLLLKVINGKI